MGLVSDKLFVRTLLTVHFSSFGFCDSTSSEYFTIRRNHTDTSLTFKTPSRCKIHTPSILINYFSVSSSVYGSGQNITLMWYSDTAISDATVYLKQDRVGSDPIQLTLLIAPFTNGTRFIRVPVNPDWPSSSNYYFEVLNLLLI